MYFYVFSPDSLWDMYIFTISNLKVAYYSEYWGTIKIYLLRYLRYKKILWGTHKREHFKETKQQQCNIFWKRVRCTVKKEKELIWAFLMIISAKNKFTATVPTYAAAAVALVVWCLTFSLSLIAAEGINDAFNKFLLFLILVPGFIPLFF